MRDLPPNMTDYLATRASFRLEVPEVYNYARDVVDAWAAKEPAKLALLAVAPDGGNPRRFSFADLAASSNRAANFLAARGIRKGDPVFVMLPRIPEWYDVVLGCVKLGAVPIPGTTLLTERDIAYRLERAGATVAATDRRTDPRRRSVAHLLHVRDGGDQDGAAHAGVAGDRAQDHRAVLAGPQADRPALDAVGLRLGQGCLGQAVRPVGAGGRQLPVGPARQAGLRPAAAADRPARGEHLLRAADGVPGAGPARPGRLRLVGPAALCVGG